MTVKSLPRLLIVLMCLASCSAGVAEFQYFRAAFDVQYDQGSKVLDRLGSAERTVVRRQTAQRSPTRGFDPDQAIYELNLGDPPLTGAIRASLDSLRTYNAALSGLASGESAAAMSTRVGASTTALASAFGALDGATGLDLGITATIAGAIDPVLPLLRQLAQIRNRVEFRRQLVAAYPDMRDLMLSLRAGTADMFVLVKRSYVQRGALGSGTTDGIPDEALARLEADRQMLAGWVILIDRTLVAMDAAVAAAGNSGQADLQGLMDASIEVQSLATTIRAISTAQN